MSAHAERLEYLRQELRAERISMGELHELQGLAEHIDPSDVELLEAAGVPEYPVAPLPDDFTLKIKLGNAAMQTPDQLADALRKVADKLTGRGDFDGPEDGHIRDFNGNTVGHWEAR